MKGENVCIFDCKKILKKNLVLMFIAVIWLKAIDKKKEVINTNIGSSDTTKQERILSNTKLFLKAIIFVG